jgi:hypothetical protein
MHIQASERAVLRLSVLARKAGGALRYRFRQGGPTRSNFEFSKNLQRAAMIRARMRPSQKRMMVLL